MNETVTTLNYILGLGGIVLLLATLILIFDYIKARSLELLVRTWGMLVALLTTAGGSVLTLIYSEVFGFIPCGLCWLQRVFLYPQVFILAVAIYYKDKTAARYGIALSVPGLIVALYQHYLQMGGSELVKCPVAGEGADCAMRFFYEFGFLTFPFMSAILFAFLIVLYFYILKTRHRDDDGTYIVSSYSETIITR